MKLSELFLSLYQNTIECTFSKEAGLSKGVSKFGGKPDLPVDFSWYYYEGKDFHDVTKSRPLAFLLQIDCEEIHPLDLDGRLPDRGMLYFFYEMETQTWGFDPKDEGSARVYYYSGPKQALAPTDFPADLVPDYRFPELRLRFHRRHDLPSYEEFLSDRSSRTFPEEELDRYEVERQAALDTENVPSSSILQRMTPPRVLFFKDVSGAYLLPEVQTQRTTAENTAVEVLRALMQGPGNSAQLSSVMRNMTLTPSPTIETAEDGVTRYVNVSLAGSRSEAQDATSMWLLCGAITLSLMYNIPDISYVRISLDGQPLTSLPGRVFSEDGTFRWDQFQGDIGDLVQLYFPNRNGTAMVGVMRAVSQEDARLASTRVEELLVGPRSTDSSGITYAFPLEVGTEDLLGVYVSGYCAYVSFSEAFYEACQGLTVQAERMMVYSIVNTLTEIENINQVQFLVEDAYVDSLGGALDLTAPLWRNPGIIQS